jgi:hypothetical protein
MILMVGSTSSGNEKEKKHLDQTSLMKYNSLTLKSTIFTTENVVNNEFLFTLESGEPLSLSSHKKD